jgi:FkbM family methyltransferase
MSSLLKNNPLVIVDVGASGGIHERWRKLGSNVKAILFEPDRNEFEKLVETQSKNSVVINSALAEGSESVKYHLCKKQQVSSTYIPNKLVLDKYEDSDRFEIEKTITLEADSMNNLLLNANIGEIDFMKIDTQGSELDIIKGASNFYENLVGLEVEVEFLELYRGQPLFSEVNSFIESKGFTLIDLKRYFWKRSAKKYSSNKGQLIFADALYLKEPEDIIALDGLNEEKIVRTTFIYMAYGYDDFAETLLDLSLQANLLSQELKEGLESHIKQHKKSIYLSNFKITNWIKPLLKNIKRIISIKGLFSSTDTNIGN